MANFTSLVLEHLLNNAIDDRHRTYINRLFPSFENFFGVMGGTVGLPVGAAEIEQAFDIMMSKFDPLDDLGRRGMKVKPIPMSQMRSIPGERSAYDVVMRTLLDDDFFTEASLNGAEMIYKANAFAVSQTKDTLSSVFGRHISTVMRHFDPELYLEMFRGYPLTAALTIVAMMQDEPAGVRSLLPKAYFLSLGLPVGSPKDDPQSFYMLYDE